MLARCRDPAFETLLVCRREDDAIAGVFDLSQIFRGIMQSGYMGYYALAPHARRGYMREGLQLMLRYAFVRLRLHRVECNIQPSNRRSIALVRGGGFVREGFSRRYLKIGGRWRDHERWAMLVEDWRTRRRACYEAGASPARSRGVIHDALIHGALGVMHHALQTRSTQS